MRLGLLTAPFPETPLTEVVDWTAANGFESIEIACWPRTSGPTRRYAGTSHIDVVNLSEQQAQELAGEIAGTGLHVSGLGYYPNPLHPDPSHREQVISHLRHVIVAASRMGVPFVNTFLGGDQAKTQDVRDGERGGERGQHERDQRDAPDVDAEGRDHERDHGDEQQRRADRQDHGASSGGVGRADPGRGPLHA